MKLFYMYFEYKTTSETRAIVRTQSDMSTKPAPNVPSHSLNATNLNPNGTLLWIRDYELALGI